MKQLCKLVNLLILTLIIFTFMFFAKPAFATSLGGIFHSPDSLIVKIQERFEYLFAFNAEKKVVVLEKQANRRLTGAEKMIVSGNTDKSLSFVRDYETLKEKQGDIIKNAPASVLSEAKKQTVEQQDRIEDIKKDMPDEARDTIEEAQKTAIKTMVDNIKTQKPKNEIEEVTKFIKEVKDVIEPGSVEVLEFAREIAPGAFEVAPSTLEVSPGTHEIAP